MGVFALLSMYSWDRQSWLLQTDGIQA